MLRSYAVAALAAIALSGTAAAQSGPNPSQVHIKRLTYSGPGCPAGGVAANLSPDAKAFTLVFDSFNAEVGPGIPGGRAKTSCRVTLDLRFPNGWSYSLFDVSYRGFMSLDQGVVAKQRSVYWFQAEAEAATDVSSSFHGPLTQDWQLNDSLGYSDLNFSPCGRNRALNIDTEISLSNLGSPLASGVITVDSMDGAFSHIYGIEWERCN